MKVKTLFFCLFALLVFGAASVFAERKVLDVPCVGQVMDMDQNKFLGYNACGPTSAVMILRFFHLQPDAPEGYPEGYYIYNGYSGFTDKSGNSYNTRFARDESSPNSGIYPHSVCGAHGFIVDFQQKSGVWTWLSIQDYLETYLENHGLQTSGSITSNLFSVIKQNIGSGLPLIAHVSGVGLNGKGYDHFLVITGYDGENVVVNDPFGDLNGTWNGSTEGNDVVYPLNGIVNVKDKEGKIIGTRTINFDHIITAYPVGLFSEGWHDENVSLSSGRSQAFVNAYRSDVGIP
ncbi:MAG: C39 family peptidase, partial [Candidatus Paceibacterota bacterium]